MTSFNINTISRIIKLCAIFAVAYAQAVFAISAQAQAAGARRFGAGKVEIEPARAVYKKIPNTERDVDLFVGRVIRVDSNIAIVRKMSSTKVEGKTPYYYGCDLRMRPTSILEKSTIAHKSCMVFKIVKGTAARDDIVMVRYFKNTDSQNATTQEINIK